MKAPLSLLLIVAALLLGAIPASAQTFTYGSMGPAYSGIQGCGGCSWFQASVSSGPSYAAPADGTITTFRMRMGDLSASVEDVTFIVVRPSGGAQYTIVHRTPITSLTGKPANSIAEIPVSLAVKAGDTVGIEYQTNKVAVGWNPGTGSPNDKQLNSNGTALNTPFTPGAPLSPTRLNLEVVLDDGKVAPPPTVPDTTAPILTGFKSKNSKFKVNSRGAIVAKSTPKGTSFGLTLSEAASVKFTVQLAKQKKGRTTYKTVQSFTRILGAGASSTAYSGRYRNSKKQKKTLTPGKYKVTAIPTDSAGNAGSTGSAKFTVLK